MKWFLVCLVMCFLVPSIAFGISHDVSGAPAACNHDVMGDFAEVKTIVRETKTPVVTTVSAEGANRWQPAPVSDAEYRILLTGAGSRVSTRTVTRSRTYASSGGGYSTAPMRPARRLFGGLFRGRLGCAMGSCY